MTWPNLRAAWNAAAGGTDKLLTLTPATLRAIAERRPANNAELARIKGMDQARMDRFGAAILSCLHSL